MDGTKNEAEGLHFEHFPTLLYYGTGDYSQNGVLYDGRLSYKSLRKYLKRKMGSDWKDQPAADAGEKKEETDL